MELSNPANDKLGVEQKQKTKMDYAAVFARVVEFAKSRRGVYRDPEETKKKRTLIKHKNDLAARDLTGGLCYCAYKYNLDTDRVISFLDKVQENIITEIPEHKVVVFEDLLPMSILTHPMYKATQQFLPYAVPGTGQMGPGEFQFCFFDASSHYVIDPTVGYDVELTPNGTKVEMKKHGTKLTCSPEKLDNYKEEQINGALDRFMVYKPISNKSLNPLKPGQFVMINLMERDWREFLEYGNDVNSPALYINRDLL